jgi:hypothetical protein
MLNIYRTQLQGCDSRCLEQPEGVLAAVGHVEEAVSILVLLVDGGHQSGCKTKVSTMFRDRARLYSNEVTMMVCVCAKETLAMYLLVGGCSLQR